MVLIKIISTVATLAGFGFFIMTILGFIAPTLGLPWKMLGKPTRWKSFLFNFGLCILLWNLAGALEDNVHKKPIAVVLSEAAPEPGDNAILVSEQAAKQSKKPTTAQREVEFSKYFVGKGSSYGEQRPLLNALIKMNLNDPDSFEHIETSYWAEIGEDYFVVTVKFRARNGFNALVINQWAFKVSPDFKDVQIIQQL